MIIHYIFRSLIVALSLVSSATARADDATIATWDVPSAAAIRAKTLAFLSELKASEAAIAEAAAAWPEATSDRWPALLDRVVATLALIEPRAKDVAAYAAGEGSAAQVPHAAWLADSKTPRFIADHLRLLAARRLIEARRLDDALKLLANVNAEDIADPATLLFHRMIAQHGMVQADDCGQTAALLLENERAIPVRYAALARLVRADVADVKEGSLDHIARRMDDLGRRIEVGQTGPQVGELADGVVKSLDELIKKAEEQRQQQQMAAKGSMAPPSAPSGDSRVLEGKGEGKVEHKNTGGGRGWGNLPAKAREEALQQIGKDFPAHYREIIEEYFRRLAAQEE